MTVRAFISILLASLLAACAQQPRDIASAPAAAARPPDTSWAFEKSNVPLDPAYRFGRLDNGMRFVIRQNRHPAGTALVRMDIAAGSLDEGDSELGFAHFVEHMAFNGSKRVPEGEMIRLLERNGLSFGADTNASTSFEQTNYKLDLPRNDPALLDVALMLMRETASELTMSDEAVERERGVVLAELRDRNTFEMRNAVDSAQFHYPGSRYAARFPIGTVETLRAASGASLRAFWAREYVPSQATVIVVGDLDPALVEAAIAKHFASWASAPAERQPGGGPVSPKDHGRAAIYLDPALTERVEISRSGKWLKEPDTIEQRQENLLRQIGYDIVNRRFLRAARQPDPPYRGAGFGTGDIFKAGRTTRLIVDVSDRMWRKGLIAAVLEYRQALEHGFTAPEVAEQVANLRTGIENAAASADTRQNGTFVEDALGLVRRRVVPATPAGVLERFNSFAAQIAPDTVLAALRREAVELAEPLIRFRGRFEPKGGSKAVRAAFNEAMRKPLAKRPDGEATAFGYTAFGTPGSVASDSREPGLGIRTLRFANGVRLNLKKTDLEKDRVLVSLAIDGGEMLNTRESPLATEMAPYLAAGGLGKHSQDELQSLLAGKTVAAGFRADGDALLASALTTPRDLETQLRLLAAYVTDPGYRNEGEVQYRYAINRYFARQRATPGSALQADIGGLVSDGDPRFTIGKPEVYRGLTYKTLAQGIGERLASGAIEIAMVGDFDEDQAIALAAATFGALPARETEFRNYAATQPPRTFTANRSARTIRHSGAADQALLRLVWPTRDDSDPVAALGLELLERVVRNAMMDTLREALGDAYSPEAASAPSRYWQGYGEFAVTASVDTGRVDAARAAIIAALRELIAKGPDADAIQRARQPMLEEYDRALKTNRGWLALADRAQSQPERIERFLKARERIAALSAADVQTLARRYIDPAQALEILVLPEAQVPPAP